MNFKNLFKMDYMTLLIQTIVLVIWLFVFYPMIIGFAGYVFTVNDPVQMGLALFSGLIVSIVTFKILRYRRVV